MIKRQTRANKKCNTFYKQNEGHCQKRSSTSGTVLTQLGNPQCSSEALLHAYQETKGSKIFWITRSNTQTGETQREKRKINSQRKNAFEECKEWRGGWWVNRDGIRVDETHWHTTHIIPHPNAVMLMSLTCLFPVCWMFTLLGVCFHVNVAANPKTHFLSILSKMALLVVHWTDNDSSFLEEGTIMVKGFIWGSPLNRLSPAGNGFLNHFC